MSKHFIKFISVLLMLVLIISSIPVTTIAQDLSFNSDSEELQYQEDSLEMVPNPDYQKKEDNLEVVDRREENVKHFRHEDDSVEAIVYGYAVHRKDSNGNWQDIDNRLFSSSKLQGTIYSTVDNRVTFSKDSTSNRLLTLSENGYIISMGYINSNMTAKANMSVSKEVMPTPEAEVFVTNHQPRAEQIDAIPNNISEQKKLEQLKTINNESSIVYKNIENGINLEYVLQSNDVKENIIINQAQQEYIFNFIIRVSGLTAELQNDGTIILFDQKTGESPYYIPAPFMYDSNGNISDDVSYSLSPINDGAYLLTVTAESKWINEPSRAFPVVVDPSLQRNAIWDTYINSSAPGSNYGSSSQLWIGTTTTSYTRATLTSIPAGSTVSSATLNVAYYYYNSVTAGTLSVGVYKVLSAWTENVWTWNRANDYSNLGLDTTRISYRTFRGDAGAYSSSPKWVSFLVTSAVQSWVDGSPNFGLALKRESGTNSDVIVCSYESGATYCPYYIIFYKEPIIEEGVYRLKNVYNGLYLTIGEKNYSSGAPIQQYASRGNDDLSQLFKITYIQDYSDSRYYDIRPMTNSALGLYAPLASSSSHNVTANSMATTDGWFDIPQTQRWTIERDGGSGYTTLLNAFSDNGGYLSTPTNSTSGASIITTTTSLGLNCQWILERYTGEDLCGVIMTSFVPFLSSKQTYTYNAYMYSSEIGTNGPVTYRVRNTDNSDTNIATINPDTGELRASRSGTFKVGVTYSNAPWIWYWTVTIDMGGTYFIQNGHYSKYIQVDDDDKPNYNTDGGVIEQWTFNGKDHQKWVVTYVGGVYYKITSKISGYAITVPSGEEEKDGANLILKPYTGSDNQKWKIALTSHKIYKIKAKSSENYSDKDLVMRVNEQGLHPDNGLNIQQRAYSNDKNYKDEWYLDLFSSHQIGLYGIEDIRHDHQSSLEYVKSNLQVSGYNNILYEYGALDPADLLENILPTIEIFTIRCHGYAPIDSNGNIITTGIILNNESVASRGIGLFGCEYADMLEGSCYITSLDNFSNLKLVLLVGCETAAGGENNLPAALVRQGATTVVGFTDSIGCDAANQWLKSFYDELLSGATVKTAIANINQNSGGGNGLNSAVIYGDPYYRLGD